MPSFNRSAQVLDSLDLVDQALAQQSWYQAVLLVFLLLHASLRGCRSQWNGDRCRDTKVDREVIFLTCANRLIEEDSCQDYRGRHLGWHCLPNQTRQSCRVVVNRLVDNTAFHTA